MAVPTIDIAPFVQQDAYDDAARDAVAKEWDRAMTEVGFAVIQGHGVAPEVITDLRDGAHSFFTEDASVKNAFNYGPYGNPLGGFTAMGIEAVSRTRDEHGSDGGSDEAEKQKQKTALPDLVESFVFFPDSPKPKPQSFDAAGRAYHRELLRVLNCLHRVTAAALGLPTDYFAPFYTPHAEVFLRLAYYPPVSPEAQSSSAVRYGEHTDYTGYTILHQDETDVGQLDAGGLQVSAGHVSPFTPRVRSCMHTSAHENIDPATHLRTLPSVSVRDDACRFFCEAVSGTQCDLSPVLLWSTSATCMRSGQMVAGAQPCIVCSSRHWVRQLPLKRVSPSLFSRARTTMQSSRRCPPA